MPASEQMEKRLSLDSNDCCIQFHFIIEFGYICHWWNVSERCCASLSLSLTLRSASIHIDFSSIGMSTPLCDDRANGFW